MSFYHTKESVDEYIKMAEGFDGKYLIKKLSPYLSKESLILELGSGPGKDWEILNDSYQVVGSDLSDEFLKRLRENYPDDRFLKLNACDLETDLKFDVIYSNKVLHHLNLDELKKSLKRQYEILNTNGLICHSFWKGEGEEYYNEMFVQNHTKITLENHCENYFEILLLKEYQEFEDNDSIILIGRKK